MLARLEAHIENIKGTKDEKFASAVGACGSAHAHALGSRMPREPALSLEAHRL